VRTVAAGTLGFAVQGGFCPDLTCTTFGVEDLTTGVFTPLGALAGFVPNNGGLAWGTGGLYTGNAATNTLYLVDTGTGNFTSVGTANVGAGNISVLAGSQGILYELALPSMDLYSFNPADGTTTLIGPTGIPAPAADLSNLFTILLTGLGPNLYTDYLRTDDAGPDSLYRINPTTGQSTLVASLSGVQCLSGLGTVNNTLYAFGVDRCSGGSAGIYTINPATGVGAFVSPEVVGPIVSVADTPEPGSLVTAGVCLMLLGLRRSTRRQIA
jgi:hypothetical protein